MGSNTAKPEAIGRKLDVQKQKAFIEAYENLLNSMGSDEAVHPTHAARPVGCWAPAKENLAIQHNSGRQRLNIHGAIDLETGKTAMIDVETVDAASTYPFAVARRRRRLRIQMDRRSRMVGSSVWILMRSIRFSMPKSVKAISPSSDVS